MPVERCRVESGPGLVFGNQIIVAHSFLSVLVLLGDRKVLFFLSALLDKPSVVGTNTLAGPPFAQLPTPDFKGTHCSKPYSTVMKYY